MYLHPAPRPSAVALDADRVHRVGNGGLTPASAVHSDAPPGLPVRHYPPDLAMMATAGGR